MYRGDSREHDLGSLPWLSKRKLDEVRLAIRNEALRRKRDGLAESELVFNPTFANFLTSVVDDTGIAVKAACQLVSRLKQPVVIQEDLSVVLEKDATLNVLERFTPDDFV